METMMDCSERSYTVSDIQAQLRQMSLRKAQRSEEATEESTEKVLKANEGRAFVGQCYNCGKPGHMSRNCYSKSRKEKRGRSAKYSRGRSQHWNHQAVNAGCTGRYDHQ